MKFSKSTVVDPQIKTFSRGIGLTWPVGERTESDTNTVQSPSEKESCMPIAGINAMSIFESLARSSSQTDWALSELKRQRFSTTVAAQRLKTSVSYVRVSACKGCKPILRY